MMLPIHYFETKHPRFSAVRQASLAEKPDKSRGEVRFTVEANERREAYIASGEDATSLTQKRRTLLLDFNAARALIKKIMRSRQPNMPETFKGIMRFLNEKRGGFWTTLDGTPYEKLGVMLSGYLGERGLKRDSYKALVQHRKDLRQKASNALSA